MGVNGQFIFTGKPPLTVTSQVEKLRNVKTLKKYISVGGGKGGIGKTFFAANLAIALSSFDVAPQLKVTVVDTDIGGSNLNNFLGIPKPRYTLSDYLRKSITDINDVAMATQFPGMNLIAGADDLLDIQGLNTKQKLKLLRSFQDLDSDFIIFDLAAGSDLKTLDFFNQANTGIIVTTPEPTAVQNAYTFLRNAMLRKIMTESNEYPVINDITTLYLKRNLEGVSSINNYIDTVRKSSDEAAAWIEDIIGNYCPRFVLNQLEHRSDSDTADRFIALTKRYLKVDLDYLGWIPYDPRVKSAVRDGKAFLEEFRKSRTAVHLYKIAETLSDYKFSKGLSTRLLR
ncbi:MAG: P-loop NTPase [Acidobacteria bacterium]|nr:P-loop NTPase [Acidobacteriota bacterium]